MMTSSVRCMVALALLLNILVLSEPALPVVRADAPCGTWSVASVQDGGSDSTQNTSARLQAALTNPGTGCTSTFTITNNTQFQIPAGLEFFVGELGGYTLETRVSQAPGAAYDWGSQSDGFALTKILSQELTVAASDPTRPANVDVTGSFSTKALLADTAVYILQTILASIPAPSCVISPSDIVVVSLQAQQHFADLASLLTNFTLVDATHVNLDAMQEAFTNQLGSVAHDVWDFASATGRGCLADGVETFQKTIEVDAAKKAAYIAGRVKDYSLWMGKWYIDYFKNTLNPDITLHYTPPQNTSPATPGGTWISPNDGDSFNGNTVHFAAHAYSGNGIYHVNFTAVQSGAPQGTPWVTACNLTAPTHDDVFECDWNFSGMSTGDALISFDAYDRANGKNLSPNGVHTIHYISPAQLPTNQVSSPPGSGITNSPQCVAIPSSPRVDFTTRSSGKIGTPESMNVGFKGSGWTPGCLIEAKFDWGYPAGKTDRYISLLGSVAVQADGTFAIQVSMPQSSPGPQLNPDDPQMGGLYGIYFVQASAGCDVTCVGPAITQLYLLLPSSSSGLSTRVDARQPWQSTGVSVQAGARVTITVTGGTWSPWPGAPNSGLGKSYDICANKAPVNTCREPLPTVPTGSLLGKVGSSIFLVGTGTTVTLSEGGTLSLQMNEVPGGFSDNDGVLTVQVSVT